MMETLIVICLLIVIALLLQDKMIISEKPGRNTEPDKRNIKLPDIMGQPKPVKSHPLPNSANEFQKDAPELNPNTPQIEPDENAGISNDEPEEDEDQDKIIDNEIDWDAEEEDWRMHEMSGEETGFAYGVTFEELSAVGMMLRKENPGTEQKQEAAAIVQKLQGTELFSLLEQSVEGASRKIAVLLDHTLSDTINTADSKVPMNQKDYNDFDIENFV